LAGAYYSMRTEEYSRYSSLFYTDAIRVFKTSEVRDVLEAHSMAVRADFARTESVPKPVYQFLEENSEERTRRTMVHDWFNSKPLSELLYNPLPPGIGTDDDRIVRSIEEVYKNADPREFDGMVVILFSGDRQLARITSSQMKKICDKPFRLLSLDRSLYTRLCLEGVRQYTKFRPPLKENERPKYIVSEREYLEYYNYLLKRRWPLPSSIMEQTRGLFPQLESPKRLLYHVEYDYPNMERGLDTIRVDPRTGTVEEYGGGYLERRTLQSLAEHDCWAKFDLESIYSWSDFDIVRSKRIYPLGSKGLREDRIYGFDPTSYETYRRIDSWRMNATSSSVRPNYDRTRRPSTLSVASIAS
jgi:hypothetical protein